MKKKPKTVDDVQPEYHPELIRRGVRGKYAARFREGTNLVPLEADVAKAFPTPKAVNDALRMFVKIADSIHQTSRKGAR